MQHTHKGRTWTEVRREPYTRKDGGAAELIVWHTKCAKCDAMVEIKTSTKFDTTKAFDMKNCEAHRRRFVPTNARKLANMQPGADLV
jgi:hypothetical protein